MRRGEGRTIVAGYPWFTDWGRDTMISLPGLCLVTGRHAALHDAQSPWLTQRYRNPTIYPFGYLFEPDGLCHWHRERLALTHLLTGVDGPLPNCAL